MKRARNAPRGAILSFQDDRDIQRSRKRELEPENAISRSKPPATKGKRSGDGVGSALRSAYQRTLQEDIPPEMLDLLGKLG